MSREQARVLCLITDRCRLGTAVGAPADVWMDLLLRQVEGAIAGGVDVVQIRERDLEAGALAALVRNCLTLAQGTATRVLVNDRLDVAIAAGANGVHLREDSVPVSVARQLMPRPATLGQSIHMPTTVDRSTVDYLLAGSVFSSLSKPDVQRRQPIGVEGLRALIARAGDRPVWAVGGVSAERLPELVRAGVAGIGAIGAFVPQCPVSEVATSVQKLTRTLRFCFDTPEGLS